MATADSRAAICQSLSEEGEVMPDQSHQMKDEPLVNKVVEDVLAIAGGDPQQEELVIHAMMLICCERLASGVGRGRCRDRLRHLDDFVRDARPARSWRD